MKKVLVINESWSDNLGDIAIGKTIHTFLEVKGFQVDSVDYTKKQKRYIGEVSNHADDNIVKRSRSSMLKDFLKQKIPIINTIIWLKNNWSIFFRLKYQRYDKVIIGGGQLLLSNGYFPVALLLWFIVNKLYFKGQIFLYGVGTGNNIAAIDRWIFKWILPKFDGIYIRDKDSINKLSKIIDSRNIKLTPDVVYYFSELFPLDQLDKEDVVLVGVTDYRTINDNCNRYKSMDEYMDEWFDLIKKHSVNHKVKLFYTTHSDKLQTYLFHRYCSSKYGIEYEVIDTDDLDKLIRALAVSKIVMSARMHAMILGINYDCEVIPFVFSDKLKSFKDEVMNNFNLSIIRTHIEQHLNEIISK
jgi:polysaccharide pyruvyl transferase WcaK-like protein